MKLKNAIIGLTIGLILSLGFFTQSSPQSKIRKEQIEDAFTRPARAESITAQWDFQTAFKMTNTTPRGVLRVDASNVIETFAPMTNGQLIIGSTGAVPSLATLTGDDGVTITPGAGSITIDLGLPTSVNVLGNRSAAGEFIQRGTLNPAAVGVTDTAAYRGSDAITFAVAFTSTPYVMAAGMTGDTGGDEIMGARSITTTGFTLTILSTLSGSNSADARWVALGS